FQAEDGIRDFHVTGVQTCALPISCAPFAVDDVVWGPGVAALAAGLLGVLEVVAVAAQVGLAPVLDAAAWAGGEARVVEARRGCEIGRASWRERVWEGGVG